MGSYYNPGVWEEWEKEAIYFVTKVKGQRVVTDTQLRSSHQETSSLGLTGFRMPLANRIPPSLYAHLCFVVTLIFSPTFVINITDLCDASVPLSSVHGLRSY